VLDVKMNTKSGEVTDAEIQVENVPQMRERLVFYAARMNGARAEGWKAGITEGEEIEKLREYPIT
ncbi:MAG: Rpn family recombination-promoting nuclease/putative transposase, partial [Planctomycetaceae bacterium]|nr:Rpn family recombination-promoting nuclease/putative transposase [Planctomycetaceae bacterium]